MAGAHAGTVHARGKRRAMATAASRAAAAQKRKKKQQRNGLAPLAAPPQNQLEASPRSARLPTQRLPLALFFVDRRARCFRRRIDVSGWDPQDQDVRVLEPAGAVIDTFVLSNSTHVTTDGLEMLQTFVQLKTLALRGCTTLTADVVHAFPASLTDLDAGYCNWMDDQATRHLLRRCPGLLRLTLCHCRRLTDYGVAAVADVPRPPLTFLDVSACVKVTDTGILAVLIKCLRLRTLRASSLVLLDGLNLEGLPRATSAIDTLDFANNSNLHASAIIHLLRVYAGPKLLSLDLTACAHVSDAVLRGLGRYCPQLQTLVLASCANVTDLGLAHLVSFMPPESEDHADYDEAEAPAAPRCTRLISLDLTGCFHVTDAGIACIGAHCPLLQTLVLDGVRRVSAAGIASVGTNCPRLQRLLWSGILIRSSRQVDGFFSIPSIDRPTLRALLDPAKTTAQLATLHVGNCKCDVNALAALLGAGHAPALTDLNVVSIASDALCQSIGSHCANLRVLRLSRSRYFSEQSFLAVPRGCHELRVLDVENCEQITDKALLALGEHCVHLEKLVVANDWQVTDRGIEHVGRRCARLFSFNVRHCPEVTLPALRAVAATKHNCVEVSSDGLTPKTASVIAFHCQELALEHAATKISRWLRRRWLERSDSSNALQRALQFLRRRKKCAARIQRWFRAQSARRREYRLLQQLLHERAERVAANWHVVLLFCRLQRALHDRVRRKRVALHEREFRAAEAQRTHKHRAATHIQRVCRGFLGRRKARRARAHAEELQRHRERMATAVQRSFRGHQGRRKARKVHEQQEDTLAAKAMAISRQCMAASQIVRVAMGCLGRRRSKQRAKYLAELAGRQQRGASAIQRAYRAHLTRVLFRRCVHSGAIALQMLFRGFMERRRARALILARAYHLEPRILILNQYAIFNREFAVEWKAKRDAGEKLALAMQRCARGYMGRVLFNAHLAAHRQLWYTRDHAARTLQHLFRSMMICIRIARLKVRLHLRNTSALQIQSTWRMFQGKVHATAVALRRDRHRKLHDTRVTLAASDAMAQSQLRLLQHGAAAIIVWAYRHTLRERGWLSPTQQRFLARQAARIQSIVRGFLDRRRVRRMREELTWVALQLQRAWRGKAGRIRWREAITDKKKRQQLQEEDDRAARVARKLTGQYGLDAYARDTRHAVVLQRWYHTLRKRQVFYDAKAVRAKAMQSKAADKLALVLHLSTESVVFQARVWRDCVERKEELTAMEDDAVEALEAELTQLKQECQAEHLLYSQAMIELNELQLGMRDQQRTKRLLQQRSETIKVRIQPFALQAKELTRESARVHLINRQLQNELQRVSECMEQFHERLRGMLLYEPLLFQGDVTALIAMLDPNGTKGSMVDWEAALEQDAAIQAALASQ